MFVTKKLFNKLLRALGLQTNCYGAVYASFHPACAYGGNLDDFLETINKRITNLETTLKDLTDYLKLEYKTETTETLPRFVKKEKK